MKTITVVLKKYKLEQSQKSKLNSDFKIQTFKLLSKIDKMIYLSIHGIKDGKFTFKCGTKYDWYLIKKNKNSHYLVLTIK